MASRKRSAGKSSAARSAASAPSPGGSEIKSAAVERGGETAPGNKDAHPTAADPSPGGSDLHQEAVQSTLPSPSTPRAKKQAEPSKRGAQVTLRGRYSPGTVVQLVKVAGAHVLRTAPGDEVVEEKKVGKDGAVQFSKGVEKDGRYFVRGYQDGFPLEVRVRGRAEADDSEVLAQDPVGYDEVRTRDGRVFGQRGQRLPHPSEL
jgi:hypothetical protein